MCKYEDSYSLTKVHLKNKVVVITGSAGGLGKALAKEFYRRGSHLALVDMDVQGLYLIKNELERPAQKISIHTADVSMEEQIISMRAEVLNAHGKIDVLINNAGISISQLFEEVLLPDYKRVFDTNFWGALYCTKYFLPDLKHQPESRLVNIISDFAFMGFPGKTAYASSKSAVMGFTNCLKTELAETAVKVSLVVPPPLATGLVRNGKHINDQKRMREVKFLEKNGMPLETAATRIVNGIQKGKFRIIVGTNMFWADVLSRLFPTALHYLIGKYKNAFDFI